MTKTAISSSHKESVFKLLGKKQSGSTAQQASTDKFANSLEDLPFTIASEDIDEAMKVAITGTANAMSKINMEARDWDGFVTALNNLTLIKQRGEEYSKYDLYTKSGTDRFQVDWRINKDVVNDVKKWFGGLVDDQNVAEATNINTAGIAKIVATKGEAITKLEVNPADKNYHEKSVVESGVLCYPYVDDPHFELYYIRLVAWANYEGGPLKSNNNGVRGVFLKRIYEPNEEIIEMMREEIRNKAIADFKVGSPANSD